MHQSRDLWKRVYRACYEAYAGRSDAEWKSWLAFLAASKLEKEAPVDHPRLMGLIRQAVNQW